MSSSCVSIRKEFAPPPAHRAEPDFVKDGELLVLDETFEDELEDLVRELVGKLKKVKTRQGRAGQALAAEGRSEGCQREAV